MAWSDVSLATETWESVSFGTETWSDVSSAAGSWEHIFKHLVSVLDSFSLKESKTGLIPLYFVNASDLMKVAESKTATEV